jgi:alpha-beta hydrolase superfamily lysophospholipase
MEHTERRIAAPDGTQLHVEQWTPEGPVRFVVAVAHGGAEHVGRYARLAERLGRSGGLVFGPDHRGQGRSGGSRGHVERFEDYATDLRHVLLDMAGSLPPEQCPSAMPWFLFGHSMGGLISLTYLLEHQCDIPLRGAIISAPLLGLAVKVHPLKLAVGTLAARLLPRLALPSGIPPEGLCRDVQVVRDYVEDTRRVDVVTAGWRAQAEVARIDLPALWYVGTGDKICDADATRRLFSRIPDADARDQTLRVFEGYYHELHNEPAELREPVFEAIEQWIEARL